MQNNMEVRKDLGGGGCCWGKIKNEGVQKEKSELKWLKIASYWIINSKKSPHFNNIEILNKYP